MSGAFVFCFLLLLLAFSPLAFAQTGGFYQGVVLTPQGPRGGASITVCSTATIAASPSGASESGTTVTITTSAAHGMTVGQSVVLTGLANSLYNGTFTVQTVPTSTTFTVTNANTGLAASGSGMVLPNNVPCSPSASIFADLGLQTAKANPLTSDGLGNFSFFAAPAMYVYSVTGTGIQTSSGGPFPVQLPCVAGVSCVAASGNNAFTGNNTASNINNIRFVDGVKFTTVQAAVNDLPVSGGMVFIPPGTWPPAAPNTALTITNPNVHIVCSGIQSSFISYTGTTIIPAVIDIGTAADGTANKPNVTVDGCTVSGNANVTNAIRARGAIHSSFKNLDLRNVTGQGLFTQFAVVSELDNIHCSLNDAAFTVIPSACVQLDGIDANHKTTNATIKNVTAEGLTGGTGVVLGQTIDITIYAGTSEQNARGLNITSGAQNTSIIGIDLEQNTTEDILFNGIGLFIGGSSSCLSAVKLHAGSTAQNVTIQTNNNTCLATTVDTGAIGIVTSISSPLATSNSVLDNTTQTLTSKTLTAPTVTNPTTTGTDSGTETLANKTLTSPALTTPTIGGGTMLTKYSRFSVSLSPALVAANTCAAQSFTITGIAAADILLSVSKPTEQAGLNVSPGHVTGANTATVNFCNNTAAGITPTAAETYQFVAVQ